MEKREIAGLKRASGKYLLFVDSDDYIENTMIEKLYHNITESHADVASCGIYNVYRQKCIPQCEKEEKFLCDVEKAFGLLLVGEKFREARAISYIAQNCLIK